MLRFASPTVWLAAFALVALLSLPPPLTPPALLGLRSWWSLCSFLFAALAALLSLLLRDRCLRCTSAVLRPLLRAVTSFGWASRRAAGLIWTHWAGLRWHCARSRCWSSRCGC